MAIRAGDVKVTVISADGKETEISGEIGLMADVQWEPLEEFSSTGERLCVPLPDSTWEGTGKFERNLFSRLWRRLIQRSWIRNFVDRALGKN